MRVFSSSIKSVEINPIYNSFNWLLPCTTRVRTSNFHNQKWITVKVFLPKVRITFLWLIQSSESNTSGLKAIRRVSFVWLNKNKTLFMQVWRESFYECSACKRQDMSGFMTKFVMPWCILLPRTFKYTRAVSCVLTFHFRLESITTTTVNT